MKSLLGLVLFNSVIHQVEVVIRSRLAAIKKRHEKKLFNLRQQNVNVSDSAVDNTQFNKIIHNFSWYNLSRDEDLAPPLSYGLHQHIRNNVTRNAIKTEFKLFYQGLLKTFPIY